MSRQLKTDKRKDNIDQHVRVPHVPNDFAVLAQLGFTSFVNYDFRSFLQEKLQKSLYPSGNRMAPSPDSR